METLYKKIIRPILFKSDAENAHHRALRSLECLAKIPLFPHWMMKWNAVTDTSGPVELFGVKFPNRVGLAAGFDKEGKVWKILPALGFGHVEIGTITGEPQEGNPKPRLFRFPDEKAVLNRMGFNNSGAEAVALRLKKHTQQGKRTFPLGINIGKSKVVPLENAVEDYLKSFRLLAPYADYITINVSSPNTPGLRSLQESGPLKALLKAIQSENAAFESSGKGVPILLKIAPDLSFPQIEEVLTIIESCKLSGVIATNTTLQRPGRLEKVDQAGGVSGSPLFPLAYQVVKFIGQMTQGRLPIIAAGGISTAGEAAEMMNVGASLVQIYSGMIYEGPFLAAKIARALSAKDRNWVYA